MIFTGFEQTGTWTTLAYEGEFIDDVASDSPRVTVVTAGTSTEGRPLRRVDITTATGPVPTVMFVGLQHGNEPAGREGLLTLIRDLAVTEDAAWVELLGRCRLVILPTMNPDGFPSRRNIPGMNDGEDPNRMHLTVEYAEPRLIQQTITDTNPVILIDCHENPNSDAVRPKASVVSTAYGALATLGSMLLSAMSAWAAGQDIPFNPYPQNPAPGVLANTSLLRHAVGMLIEMPRGRPPETRVSWYGEILAVCLAWLATSLDDVVSVSAASGAWAIDNAEAQSVPVRLLPGGVVIDPPPLSYTGLGGWPAELDVFGITGTPSTVLMAQDAALIIPYMLDEASETAVTTATRNAPPLPPPVFQLDAAAQLWVKQSGIRRPVSEVIHKAGGVRHWASEVWSKTSGVRHVI